MSNCSTASATARRKSPSPAFSSNSASTNLSSVIGSSRVLQVEVLQLHLKIDSAALPWLATLAHGGHPVIDPAGGARRDARRHDGDGPGRRAHPHTDASTA